MQGRLWLPWRAEWGPLPPQLLQRGAVCNLSALSAQATFLMHGMLPVDTGGEEEPNGSLISPLPSLLILSTSPHSDRELGHWRSAPFLRLARIRSLLVRTAAAVSSDMAPKPLLCLCRLHLVYDMELHPAAGLSGGVGGFEHGSRALCVESPLLAQHSPAASKAGSAAEPPTEQVLTVKELGTWKSPPWSAVSQCKESNCDMTSVCSMLAHAVSLHISNVAGM